MSTFDHPTLVQNIDEGLRVMREDQPDPLQAFGQLTRSAKVYDTVSSKHKKLMAMAIGVRQHSSGCIGFHVKALCKLVCNREELDEALAVCVFMGGGPALMYTAEALKARTTMA